MSEADRFGGAGGDGRRMNLTPPDQQQVPRKSSANESQAKSKQRQSPLKSSTASKGNGKPAGADKAPHHGFDNRNARSLVHDVEALDEPKVGSTYQSGGRALDRDALEDEKRSGEHSGSWKSPHAPRGAPDPAPGTPVKRRR
ncbi:hypothetical protein [Dyella sp.]|uniref:hypothetical protein n=1 Tax=Dyella sp. TaxID=1869338 RepID=UPI002ED21B10